MKELTHKHYLTLMLDSVISADFVSGWLFGPSDSQAHWQSLPMLGRGYQIKIVRAMYGDLQYDGELWPAVCMNCRKHLGEVEGGQLRDSCAACVGTTVTDSWRAASRLVSIFKEANIKSIAPICMHLIETPIDPSRQARIEASKQKHWEK